MRMRMMPLMIGVAVCGVAFGQTTQVPPPPPPVAAQQTTRVTTRSTRMLPTAAEDTTTTTTTRWSRPQHALSEGTIKSDIADAGYKEVKDLEFKDGVWQTKARGGNDKWTDLRIGAVTGKVYSADAPSRLNKNEIKAKLTAQGYEDIGHVQFEQGLWSARAEPGNSRKTVHLLVDPDNGNVVAQSH